MKKQLVAALALMFIAGYGLADEEVKEYHYTLISPPEYTSDWQSYINMRATQRSDVEFKLVSTATIYESYPFNPDATAGAPRNPAESIHAWIRNEMKDVTEEADRAKYYFVLGGSWAKAQGITSVDDTRLQTRIPGVYIQPRRDGNVNLIDDDPENPVSDMFYACIDVEEGKWPWDGNANGKYLDQQERMNGDNDYYADVVISRIPIAKHPSATPQQVIAAFAQKVAWVEAADFPGKYHFAAAGGQVAATFNMSNSRTMREEREFYDGEFNMFDPRHGGKWLDAEELPRNTCKNMIAPRRPVLEGNPLFVYGWGANHATIEAATAHYFSHDREAVEYRDHGSSQDLYCKYINVNAYLGATGITRMIFSGFSCMTGHLDSDYMTLAEAEIESLNGGTVASIHNTRYGFGTNNVRTDDDGLSSSLQYYMKVGVFEQDMDIGSAWLYARKRYYKRGAEGNTARFVLAEQVLLGDPLIKLSPAVPETTITETTIEPTEDTGYTTLNVKGGTSITSDKLFKVMTALNVTDGNTLRFAADGGVGGSGVNFASENGTLTVASPTKAYMIQPTGASEVVLAGSGTTLDFDTAAPKFSTLTLVGEGETMQTGNILRGRTAGQLKDFLPLAVENTCIALGTVNAFEGATSDTFATVENGGLGITFNPNYGLNNCWEYFTGVIALNNGTLYVDRTATAGFGAPDNLGLAVSVSGDSSVVETINGGKATLFGTTTFTLASDATLTFNASILADESTEGKIVIEGGRTIVESDIGIGGEVTINSGTLVLNEIPLRNVSKLTLTGNSKLVLPTNDDGFYQILFMSGATLDLSEETQIVGSNDESTELEGQLQGGAFFDTTKFVVWNQASGDLTDTQSGAGKFYFPDIANTETVTVNLPQTVSCTFVAFGNQNSAYKFTGEALTVNNPLVVNGDITFNSIKTSRLEIKEGATFAANGLENKIDTIKGVRFYPIKTNGGGTTAMVLELQFNTSSGKLPLSEEGFSYTSDFGKVENEPNLRDGKQYGLDSMPGNIRSCRITVDDSDYWSNERFYLQYMFTNAQPMPTSYGIAASGFADESPKTQSLIGFRVDVTSDGENWVTVSRVTEGVTVVSAGWNEMWCNSSATAFSTLLPPTDVIVSEGATLLAQGTFTAKVDFAEGAILRPVNGATLTLANKSSIILPETGTIKIDVSDPNVVADTTIISGYTFTEEDLAKFELVGRKGLRLALGENGSLILKNARRSPRITVQ